jgi:hypothetical protein
MMAFPAEKAGRAFRDKASEKVAFLLQSLTQPIDNGLK